MKCRHCHIGKVCRPRGLCWNCFYRQGVRELYPIVSKFHKNNIKDFCGQPPLPRPTSAPPRTPEKLAVLVERAELKQSLWHPDDCGGQ